MQGVAMKPEEIRQWPIKDTPSGRWYLNPGIRENLEELATKAEGYADRKNMPHNRHRLPHEFVLKVWMIAWCMFVLGAVALAVYLSW
jgi:hypothetical protein